MTRALESSLSETLDGYRRTLALQFFRYPFIGPGQTIFERYLRLPFQDFAQTSVVAIAAADTLRLGSVIALADAFAGDVRDDVHQFVDRDHPVLPQIDRLAIIALHQP